MKKKILSLTLALTLGLGLLTVPASAAEVTVVKPLEGYEKCFNYQIYSDGMLAVEKTDGGNTYLDRNGDEIAGGPFDQVQDFSEGLAAAQPKLTNWRDYKGYGYIDKTGEMVIEPQFNFAGQFHEGVARVQDAETKKYGIIDKTGNVVIPLEYGRNNNGAYVHEPSDGLILAYDEPNGYWGYFDTKGNIAIPFQYASADDFHAGYAKVRLGKKETFIDKTGRDILGDHYEYPEQLTLEGEPVALFSARDTAATDRNSYYVFDGNGQVVAGPYESFGRGGFDKGFVSGLMAVCKADGGDYKHGYINTAGQEVIPCGTYKPINSSAINAFVDGYALVNTQDNTRVIINTAGQITATLPQDLKYNAEKWSGGFLAVSSDESGRNRWGFINAYGQQVVECKYQYVAAFSGGVAVVQDFAGKYGLVNAAGQEIVPCKYNSIDKFINGVAVVSIDNRYGLINTAGQEILPCVYDDDSSVNSGSTGALKNTLQNGGEEVCAILRNRDTGRYDFIRITTDYVAPTQPAIPTQPVTPVQPAANTAYASTQKVLVDGTSVEFQCYALKDASGNATNYIKLRDMASILNGTSVQFQVGWNGAVNIETGKAYTPNGSEMNTPFSGDRGYEAATAATNVNGAPAALEAIVLTDDQGGAYTYYKLRDLGSALGFKVDWSAEKGIFIETK